MSNNTERDFDLTGLCMIGLMGLGVYGAIKVVKMGDISKKLDMSIRDLSSRTHVDVSQAIVNKAIHNAVEKEVRYSVRKTADKIGDKLYGDMTGKIGELVKSKYKEISDKASDEVASYVSRIGDEPEFRNRVAERAEEKVMNKLESSTSEALEKFNRGLSSITKIYEGISNAMSGSKSGNGLTFRVDS